MSANPFIYFSGDSYMAGTELADDTLQCWKDMFGRYQAQPDARYAEFLKAKTKETLDWSDSQYAQYMCCQRDRHWTSIVCDKHGIKHHNDGLGGSSQEAVLHRAIISFDKFERDGNVPTLAIIQLTRPGRVTVYKDGVRRPSVKDLHNITPHTMFDFSILLDTDNTAAKTSTSYRLAHMDVESNIGNIIRWLSTRAITNSFFKEKTGRYPIYVGGWVHKAGADHIVFDPISNNETISSSPGYQSLVTQSRVHTVNHNIWNLRQGYTDNLVCPGGHHTPQTHANFAQFIAPHVLQELNDVS